MTTNTSTLKAAVIGAGHLGTFHCRVLSELPGVELCYVVDTDLDRAQQATSRYGGTPLPTYTDILSDVDIVSVVTPTTAHHAVAVDFIEAGVNVLVEKPITATVDEADDLIARAARNGVKLQVGHIERFNPAFRAIRDELRSPAFIECHRLSPYNFRSTDVSVVLDLMIHDLDLILDITGAPVESIEAAGTTILSNSTDIANARLRFQSPDGEPGCVANVTASRVSLTPMRRLRVFQADSYFSIDFLEKTVRVFRKKPDFDIAKTDPAQLAKIARLSGELALGQLIDIQSLSVDQADALKDEVESFITAVRTDTPPVVTGEHGRRALALAAAIESDVRTFFDERSS